MKRVIKHAEADAMRAMWKFLFEGHDEWLKRIRKDWSHLVDNGPIGDPLQIFLELALFNAQVRPLLETITKVDGFTVLGIEGRDALDAVTMARLFIAYVFDNCEGRLARIISFGFTAECQAKLRLLLHDVLSPHLSYQQAQAAILYDLGGHFHVREFLPADELQPPKLQYGCNYNDLFLVKEKVNWHNIDFGMPQPFLDKLREDRLIPDRKKWIHFEFEACEKERGSVPLILRVAYFLRPEQTIEEAIAFCEHLATKHHCVGQADRAEQG